MLDRVNNLAVNKAVLQALEVSSAYVSEVVVLDNNFKFILRLIDKDTLANVEVVEEL